MSGETKLAYLVNKSGFPMDKNTMEAVFDYCAGQNKTNEASINSLKYIYTEEIEATLPRIRPPHLTLDALLEPRSKLEHIQAYISKFTYNYTGVQFFQINRKASLDRLKDLAKLMIDAALPIKCLEATILAIFLTQGQQEFKRFTVSFSSEFEGSPFRHVVLGLYSNGKYGALGLSRRSDLMYKPLEYSSLTSLIQSYIKAYARHHHKVVKVKIGLPIPHEPHRFELVPWRGLILTPAGFNRNLDCRYVLEQYSRLIRGHTEAILLRNPPTHLPSLSYCYPAANKHPRRHLNHAKRGTVGSARVLVRVRSRLAHGDHPRGAVKLQTGAKESASSAVREESKTKAQTQYQVRV